MKKGIWWIDLHNNMIIWRLLSLDFFFKCISVCLLFGLIVYFSKYVNVHYIVWKITSKKLLCHFRLFAILSYLQLQLSSSFTFVLSDCALSSSTATKPMSGLCFTKSECLSNGGTNQGTCASGENFFNAHVPSQFLGKFANFSIWHLVERERQS